MTSDTLETGGLPPPRAPQPPLPFQALQTMSAQRLAWRVLYGLMGGMLGWAIGYALATVAFALDADLTKVNPAARLRKRGAENIGRRVLSDHELGVFWSGVVAPPVSRRVGLALRLQLLTGARPGEVAGIARNEIEHLDDDNRAAWVIPSERVKIDMK